MPFTISVKYMLENWDLSETVFYIGYFGVLEVQLNYIAYNEILRWFNLF